MCSSGLVFSATQREMSFSVRTNAEVGTPALGVHARSQVEREGTQPQPPRRPARAIPGERDEAAGREYAESRLRRCQSEHRAALA
jgi:hypothetical protein